MSSTPTAPHRHRTQLHIHHVKLQIGNLSHFGPNAGAEACERPDSWCSHPGAVFKEADCDGDGLLDLACESTGPVLSGYQWLMLTSSDCEEAQTRNGSLFRRCGPSFYPSE